MTVSESCIIKHEHTSTLITSPGKKGENLSTHGMQPQICTCVSLPLPHHVVTWLAWPFQSTQGAQTGARELSHHGAEGPRLWLLLTP
jgi:hypothetical protein